MFQGPAEIGRDAIFDTKLSVHGVVNLYSSLPAHEQSFARKCLSYRDVRIGNPKDSKNRIGDIGFNRTPVKLSLSAFTVIHIFPTGCFSESTIRDLGRLWDDAELLEELNIWEPPANWRHGWNLEKRFNNEGLLLFHEKIDYSNQYIQFAERGIIEAVDVHDWSFHHRTIPAIHWENGILNILRSLLKALKLIGGETPAFICLSIRGSLEYMTVSYDEDAIEQNRDDAMKRHRMGIKEDLLTMPPAILSAFDEDLETLMKPCFDALARAGGQPRSPRYRK